MSARAFTLLTLLTLIGLLLHLTNARIVLITAERFNPNYGSSPGVKLRVTQKGADHLKELGVRLLGEQLANLNGFRLQHSYSSPGGLQGTIHLTEIRTTNYQPPRASYIRFLPPSYISFAIEDISIAVAGRFHGMAGPIELPGRMHGQLVGMRITLLTAFRATSDGSMAVNVANCSTYLQHTHFTLDPEGPLGPIVKLFELQINDLIRQRIPDLLCRGLQNIIEKNAPRLFARLNNAQLGQHFASFDSQQSPVIDGFIQRLTQGLYMDGRSLADPIITNDYFETQQRGELRYDNSRESPPFNPKPIPHESDSEHMLYMYGSDYTLNSLLYHAYASDRLTMRLNQSILPELYQGLLRTTCQSPVVPDAGATGDFLQGICIGKLIPALSQNYPNSTVNLILLPASLPEMRFFPQLSSMDLKTRIITYVKGHQVLVSSADGVADIKLHADDGKFSGDLKLRKLDVRLHRSAIPIDPESISQLAPLAKMFLGPSLAAGLKQGAPYPLKESITFIRPRLTMHEGYARLATDFQLVEESLRDKMRRAFEEIKNEI